MEIIILKGVACICATIIAGIMALKGEDEIASFTLLFVLGIIFIPWDKVIEML